MTIKIKKMSSFYDDIFNYPHGVPEEIRTPDTRLRRPLLYPTELLGHIC